jgi:two-component system, OmpR family, sensor histidine kinase BaeS
MSLRQRLVLAVVGSGLFMVAVVALARQLIVSRAAESELRSVLEARVDSIGRARCEEGLVPGPGPRGPLGFGPLPHEGPDAPGPGRPPGRRRRVDVFFFGKDFVPRIEGSPPFPDEARASLVRGDAFAVVPARGGPEALVGVLATGWDAERCAYAMAALPRPLPLLPPVVLVLAPILFLAAVAGALYVAAGSPVRRLRALAREVRAAATSRYEKEVRVEGHDEIAGLARAFGDATATVRSHLRTVEDRERALRDFVGHTTHDVGVPLSVLAGALTEMRERIALGEGIDPLLATATQETHYISSLLHNLGVVARLETEETLGDKHPVDLAALVERVVVRHRAVARGAQVELNHAVPHPPPWVLGDVTLLEQAVNNLVHNAIRYNRPGGHVAVVLDADAARFELKVTDDGPGVGAEELKHLGEPRFRGGEARSRRPEGTGVGLAIARDVAVRHGLTLVFRSPESGGFVASLGGPGLL